MVHYVAVQGDFERSIRLEEDLEVVYSYFTDFNFILPRLPEIERVLRYADNRYRMIFGADDGRGHELGIVFDIRHEMLENRHIKMVSLPVAQHDIQQDPRLQNSKGPLFPGKFSGETLFHQQPNHIEVIYRVRLEIEIEVPHFLNFLPKKMLQQIGDTMMKVKLSSVGDGMARRMSMDFQEWCEANRAKLPVGVRAGRQTTSAQVQQSRIIQSADPRPSNELN